NQCVFDRARKLRQEPVSGVLDNAATMFSNCGGDSVRQFRVRSLFVIMHEPRVASHVGSQYRRQPALHPDWPLLHHGPQSNRHSTFVRWIKRQSQADLTDRPSAMSVIWYLALLR